MSVEGDHHYVPQFHLGRCAGFDGKLRQWSRIAHNGKLVSKPVYPAGTAYHPGLYSLRDVPAEHVQAIEREAFGLIDRRASDVLDRLIREGVHHSSQEDRYWWAVYLVAAQVRVPEHVIGISKEFSEKLRAVLGDPNDPEFLEAKGDRPEETLLEWAKEKAPAYLSNAGLRFLIDFIGKRQPLERLLRFRWMVVDVSKASRQLMLGDNPYQRVGGLYEKRCLIGIPLSPTHAFFATNDRATFEHLGAMQPRDIVKALNISTLSSARKFVYGIAEENFVDRYLLRKSSEAQTP